jgi:hypothetical protein
MTAPILSPPLRVWDNAAVPVVAAVGPRRPAQKIAPLASLSHWEAPYGPSSVAHGRGTQESKGHPRSVPRAPSLLCCPSRGLSKRTAGVAYCGAAFVAIENPHPQLHAAHGTRSGRRPRDTLSPSVVPSWPALPFGRQTHTAGQSAARRLSCRAPSAAAERRRIGLLLCLPLGRCGISALRSCRDAYECRDGALIAVGAASSRADHPGGPTQTARGLPTLFSFFCLHPNRIQTFTLTI